MTNHTAFLRTKASFIMSRKGMDEAIPISQKFVKHPAIKGDVRAFLRGQLDAYDKTHPAVLAATAKDYTRKAARLNRSRDANGWILGLESMAGTDSSFYALRAALLFDAAIQGRAALKALSEADRAGDRAGKDAAWQAIFAAAADFASYPPGSRKEIAQQNAHVEATELHAEKPEIFDCPVPPKVGDWSRAKKEGRAKPTKKRSNSKRAAEEGLRKTDPRWRDKIFDAMPAQWKTACAILSLAGCRPEELKKGVKIEVNRDKTAVRLTIQGAKINNGHGQPLRCLIIRDQSAEFEFLVAHSWGQILPAGLKDQLGALRKALNYCGGKVFPEGPSVSPYCFRHALAADLKADGASREQIALALGHSVTETATVYGRANGGTKGTRQIMSAGSRPVKVNHGLGVGKSAKSSPVTMDTGYISPGFAPDWE